MQKKKTLILGASTNPARYSYLASNRLVEAGYDIIPVGIKKGKVAGKEIVNDVSLLDLNDEVDTVTLYLSPQRQKEYYDLIIDLAPNRIIFNPGTENHELSKMAREAGIETLNACTLVMLASQTY